MTAQQDHRQYRQRALELAVQTVATAKHFTDGQIVRTASLYDKFMWDGAVPPTPQPAEGGGDAEVRGGVDE